MMTNSARPAARSCASARQHGTTMLEVLITMVILAFGLLGLAAFQSKAQVGSIESYQRAQAVVLLGDMGARIMNNSTLAATYADPVTVPPTPAKVYGTGDVDQPASCAGLTGKAFDVCEWGLALTGANEQSSGAAKLGAMTGARGCIVVLQQEDTTNGVCKPGIYQISVAWQGLHKTKAPATGLGCGKDLYGAEEYRRVAATVVTVALNGCL